MHVEPDLSRILVPTCFNPLISLEVHNRPTVKIRRGLTKSQVIDTLNKALQDILKAEDVKARLLDLGIEARSETPAELSERLRSDIEKWRAVIEKAGIPKQ